MRICRYDGREEIIDPRNYEAVKDVELSYVKSVQNMAAHTKVSWNDIMKMTSRNPAEYVGISDRKGSIAPGKDGDLTILDQDLNLVCTYCRGEEFRP